MRNLKRGKIEEQENERENQMQVKIGDFFFFFCLWNGEKENQVCSVLSSLSASALLEKKTTAAFLWWALLSRRRRTMKIKSNERSASKGLSNSSVVQHTHTDTRTHPHPHRYTQTLNRERRSSRWALSWLTVTHWWEQNSTRLFVFLSFSHWQNTNHY